MILSAAPTAPPSESDEIDRVIAGFDAVWRLGKLPCRLTFSKDLEQAFAAETAGARNRELALTISLSCGFYMATTLTDPVFVPDLGTTGLLLRSLAMPLLILTAVCASRLTSRARESLLTAAAIAALLLLIVVSARSGAPLAPFSYATVGLAMIYANTTFPLRFGHACLSTAICSAGLFVAIGTARALGPGLTFALDLQVVTAALSSLIASYRIERSLRLSYLLAAKGRGRLSALAVEREQFETLAQTDGLTGLANRIQLDMRSAVLFGDPANAGRRLGLLIIDVDHFKRYNDHYGHVAGDACLRALAAVFADVLPAQDALAVRFGGEEFVVLLSDLSVDRVNAIALTVQHAVVERRMAHANREDGQSFVTVSIGVADMIIGDGSNLVDLLDRADRALYAAKRLGRNRVEALWAVAA